MENNLVIILCPLADPDLQIRGTGRGRVGDGHLDPEIRGPGLKKKFFSALRGSVWSKNKEGGGGGLGLSPGSATDASLFFSHSLCVLWHSNCKGNQNSSDGHCNGVFSYPTTTLDQVSIELGYTIFTERGHQITRVDADKSSGESVQLIGAKSIKQNL